MSKRRTKFVFLQIKIKTLAAEGAEIHREERKWPKPAADARFIDTVRGRLRYRRIATVRREARNAQLAYGYLRGKPYRTIEAKCFNKPNAQAIAQIVGRFMDGDYHPYCITIGERSDITAAVRRWLEAPQAVSTLQAAE